jgi:hypothetical protein
MSLTVIPLKLNPSSVWMQQTVTSFSQGVKIPSAINVAVSLAESSRVSSVFIVPTFRACHHVKQVCHNNSIGSVSSIFNSYFSQSKIFLKLLWHK